MSEDNRMDTTKSWYESNQKSMINHEDEILQRWQIVL